MESDSETQMLMKLVGGDVTKTNSQEDTSGTNGADNSQTRGPTTENLNVEQSVTVSSQNVNGSSSSWCGYGNGDSDIFTPITRQEIFLSGSDTQNSHAVYGQLVEITPSEASLCMKAAAGSNKVKINPVVNFDWEHRYYTGNLVTVHLNQTHIAYVLRGKSGGIVRVTNRKTAERILLKNFSGLVVDISFAFTSRIILGIVDEPGNMYIYEITEGADGRLRDSLMLHVLRPTGTVPTDFHRLIWCSYIPDDSSGAAGYYDDSMLMLLTHAENAELWHVGKVLGQPNLSNPVLPSQVTAGFYEIHSHSKPITDAVFSPDGTAVATASQDGDVKFFKFDISNDEPPTCIHQWQPHRGRPLSSLFFMDDHKHPNSDIQFWKFVITGADYNCELKIWSCQTWTCLQTIRFSPLNDLVLHAGAFRIKACLDLSATYLVLSDINRQVLYILELFQDCESSQAHVCSLSEFLLMQPCLSFSILDAGRRKLTKEDLQYSDDHGWSCTTGEIGGEENGEDVPLDVDLPDVGVLVRLYSIHTRAMQELQIRYKPQSSIVNKPSGSSSSVITDLSSTGLQDLLSDASLPSEFDPVSDRLSVLQLQASPNLDSLSSLDPSTTRTTNLQPLLLTPDAFISPRRPGSMTVSSVSESLTLVTAMNEDESSCLTVDGLPNTFGLNNPASEAPVITTSHIQQEFDPLAVTTPDKAFDPNRTFVKTSLEANLPHQSLNADSVSALMKEEEDEEEEVEEEEVEEEEQSSSEQQLVRKSQEQTDGLLKRIGERSHLLSSGSSSSASQEVTEILQGHNRSEPEPNERVEDDEDEISKRDDSVQDEGNLCKDDAQSSRSDNSDEEEESDGNADEDDEGDGDDDYNVNENDEDIITELKENETEARTTSMQEWPQAAGVINVDELIQKTEEANRRFSPPAPPMDDTGFAEVKKSMQELMELVRMQKDEIEMLRSEIRQQRDWTHSIEHLQHRIDSLSEMLQMKMAEILSDCSPAKFEQLQKTMQDLNMQNHPRYEEITSAIIRTVQESVTQQLDRVVCNEMQRSIIPWIETSLEPLKEQFHAELAQKLTPIDAVLKDNISRMLRSKPAVENLSQAASNQMQESLSMIYKNLVIPSLDRSCQELMQKMSSLLQQGSLEYLQQMETSIKQSRQLMEDEQRSSSQQLSSITEVFHRTEDLQQQSEGQLLTLISTLQTALSQLQQRHVTSEESLKTKLNQLHELLLDQMRQVVTEQIAHLVQEQQTVLHDQLQNVLRSGAATPIHAFCDPQHQQLHISNLLRQGKYDAAFQQALSATDLTLVEYICESTDPSIVFSADSPCPLGQPVLLSLIQQLSASLNSKTELKHRFLEEAILNLDQSSNVTKEHLTTIIGQLCNKLRAYVNSAKPRDPMCQPLAKLLRVCELILRAQNK